MGTHTTTNTTQQSSGSYTNTYNPTSLAAYNTAVATSMPILTGYASNPFGNPFFSTQVQMGSKNAAQIGGQANSAVQSNLNIRGINDNSAAAVSIGQRQGILNSGLQQNAFLNAVNSAQLNQWNALGLLTNYRPLQTGGTQQSSGSSSQTTQTGGLGTWLPQVIGAGVGAVGGAMTGGLTGALGGALGNPSMFSGGGGGGGTFSGGSIGGVPAPQLGSPSYMPGGGPSVAAPSMSSLNIGGGSMPNLYGGYSAPMPTYTP